MSKRTIGAGAGVVLTLIVSLFLLSACGDYVYKEGDFSLTVSADKTKVHVGDVVKITATLKNLSGKNIRVQLDPKETKLEEVLIIAFVKENEKHRYSVISIAGPELRRTIKKGAVIKKTLEFKIEKLVNYEYSALASFDAGAGYKNRVGIYSEKMKIFVTE